MLVYKGFDKNLKCRGVQYEIGGTHEEPEADICKKGIHGCERPLDVFAYYPPGLQSRYCTAELDTNEQRSDDSKRVGKKVKINAEIGIVGLVKAQIQYVKEHITHSELAGYSGAATAGESGAATSKGKSAVGKNGLAVARGKNIKVKGGLGAVLVIAEENNYDFNLKEYKLAVVDGKEIKEDTWYKLENGKFVESEEELDNE